MSPCLEASTCCHQETSSKSLAGVEEVLYNLTTLVLPPACHELPFLCPCAFASQPFSHLFKMKLILSEVFIAVPGRVGSSTLQITVSHAVL